MIVASPTMTGRGSSSSSEELFTNVAAHSHGAARVAVALSWRRGRLTIDFVDDGPPFDPLAHAGPDLDAPAEQRPIGGLGIAIVRAFVDRGRYCRKGDCNHLRLVRGLGRAEKNGGRAVIT